MRSSRRRLGLRAAASLTLGVLVLAACGGDPPSATGAATDAPIAFAEVFASTTPLDGDAFDGAELVGTDAVVWFWAPWCSSCRAEAPEVAEVAERYAERVTFVGVPGRGQLDAMREFVDDTGTSALTHAADLDGSVWSAFGVYGQPAFAFIDDTGEVEVFIGGMGGRALADRIDALLAG